MPEKKEIWNQITTSLESTLPRSEFVTWFSRTALKKLDPNLAIVEVPNKFIATWLQEHYVHQIQASFEKKLNIAPAIQFSYTFPSAVQETPAADRFQGRHPSFAHDLDPVRTFQNFVTGTTNQFAYTVAVEVARTTDVKYNPIYIFGRSGLGKTHLLSAIGNDLREQSPRANVPFLTMNRYTSEFTYALRNEKLVEFRENYDNLNMLLVDDVHLLSGRNKVQDEFMCTFNAFYESGRQIVLTATHSPTQIPNLNDQLASRLAWGLLAEIQDPDQETKIRIIKQKAKEQNTEFPDDVTFFLANTSADVSTLIKNLVRLISISSIYQQKIDISKAKSILEKRRSSHVRIEDIQRITAAYFNISISELLSSKKKRSISYPRQIAMFLSRKLTQLSFKEISEGFGRKDHSTVIYSVNRIEKDKDRVKEVRDDINKIRGLLS
jgi:chromosomal replication initiator protein